MTVQNEANKAIDAIQSIGDDTSRFTLEESLEFYQEVYAFCVDAIAGIQDDLRRQNDWDRIHS